MERQLINPQILTDIADAIREKTSTTDTIKPIEMAEKIDAISGGGSMSCADLLYYALSVDKASYPCVTVIDTSWSQKYICFSQTPPTLPSDGSQITLNNTYNCSLGNKVPYLNINNATDLTIMALRSTRNPQTSATFNPVKSSKIATNYDNSGLDFDTIYDLNGPFSIE